MVPQRAYVPVFIYHVTLQKLPCSQQFLNLSFRPGECGPVILILFNSFQHSVPMCALAWFSASFLARRPLGERRRERAFGTLHAQASTDHTCALLPAVCEGEQGLIWGLPLYLQTFFPTQRRSPQDLFTSANFRERPQNNKDRPSTSKQTSKCMSCGADSRRYESCSRAIQYKWHNCRRKRYASTRQLTLPPCSTSCASHPLHFPVAFVQALQRVVTRIPRDTMHVCCTEVMHVGLSPPDVTCNQQTNAVRARSLSCSRTRPARFSSHVHGEPCRSPHTQVSGMLQYWHLMDTTHASQAVTPCMWTPFLTRQWMLNEEIAGVVQHSYQRMCAADYTWGACTPRIRETLHLC